MEWYLPVIWAALIGTAVAMYVILDGFDLGIGILFPYAGSERERDQMMNSVAPFWDGNETWLVLGGGGLLVAFPKGLFGDHAGLLPADHRHAARAGAAWRCLRVSLGLAQPLILERRLRGRLDARRVVSGCDPRRPDPRREGRERRICRRSVRLGHALCAPVRDRRRRSVTRCSARPG